MTANADSAAAPPIPRLGKSVVLAFAGAVLGCAAVILVTLILGVWILFLAFPLFIVFLIFSGLIAASVTALLARFWIRRFTPTAIMIVSAVLTFLLFSALPLYFELRGSSRAGGLLFG